MTDNCEVCKGANGGVPGNENVINGVVTCDYCHAKMDRQLQQLIELAAEGAGYVIQHMHEGSPWAWVYEPNGVVDQHGEMPIFKWDPLNDDGDALRLAVHLDLLIQCKEFGDGWISVGDFLEFTQPDKQAAIRKAIVRAAAHIGLMKQ